MDFVELKFVYFVGIEIYRFGKIKILKFGKIKICECGKNWKLKFQNLPKIKISKALKH